MRLGLCAALAVATLFVPASATAQPGPAVQAPPTTRYDQAALVDPDVALGANWRQSSDVLVTGLGDTEGFHLYVAKEKDAFAWTTLVTLNAGLTGVGAWTGNVCVTGSGRYAAVVFAPATFANKPKLVKGGAFAAVVDLQSSKVSPIAEPVQLAYFNPSCGPTDRVLLTRSTAVEQPKTDLITVDPAAGKAIGTRRIDAHLTNPVPAPDGDYGVVSGALSRVDPSGKLTTIAKPGGQPFAVQATGTGAIDLLTVQRPAEGAAERAVAYRYVNGKQTRLGDAPRTKLELFRLSGGRNILAGDISGINATGQNDLTLAGASKKVRAVSQQGHLLALEMLTDRAAQAPALLAGAKTPSPTTGTFRATVQATGTGRISTGTVGTERKPAADVPPSTGGGRTTSGMTTMGDNNTKPKCIVPRNDVKRQSRQPSANQVEWAVDLAVHGELKIQRPAGYLYPGSAAYVPQTLFKPVSGPQVPAQIMLAVLAQETNMYQASWHAVPGDTGNPLVSDYYGHRAWGGDVEVIDFDEADCGYGISQVTDGMVFGSSRWTAQQQNAIALDYAANIAAGLQILVAKYNEVRATNSWVNNDDPRYLENWYLAVWGYNSGIHAIGPGGYGVGFFNNPANPDYPANREPFLRGSLDDASHPSDWTYPEKIMGWAETPQWQWIDPFTKYASPDFGPDSGGLLALPSRYQFCGPVNNCDEDQPDPCPSWNELCYWHGTTSWLEANSELEFAKEQLSYLPGFPEPSVIRVYPTNCAPLSAAGAIIVDDLASTADNRLGCANQPWGGKFTMRTGSPTGIHWSEYAKIDLHQAGAGYLGHMWFSHAYDPDFRTGNTAAMLHRIVGTWTPNLPTVGGYDILVHLPSHGANVPAAEYIIKSDTIGTLESSCVIDQDASTLGEDRWVNLGRYLLKPGAHVQLSNMIDDGTFGEVDIAWDAVAFVPQQGTARACGTRYN
ncbi:hypothetical protein ACIBF5_03450 [Micromonospora sp. NPDC050417]|uniref:golvesin C-terminal-like domain-containing protein n=1 Tax=Micromonospora sp. NPDC050417 TaxID=3364280 RepID=UPI0037A3136D